MVKRNQIFIELVAINTIRTNSCKDDVSCELSIAVLIAA